MKNAGLKMKASIEAILTAHGYLQQFNESKMFDLYVEVDQFMPLVIERIGNRACIGHFFKQNGDCMYDPEIVFLLPEWEAIEITQDPVGQYHAKYRMEGVVKQTNVAFEKNVLPLVEMWATNLIEQGFACTEGTKVDSTSHAKEKI